MIVAFENNVVCSDEKVRDYLLARKKIRMRTHYVWFVCIRRKTLMALIVWT